MRNTSHITFTAADLTRRWSYKAPSSILRIMNRFGITGMKFGDSRQAARRFSLEEVELVERLAGASIVRRRATDVRTVPAHGSLKT